MINDNTIISSFNDRPTLLEWLKKVEDALKTDTATGVSVENPYVNSYIFKITFADGSTIASEPVKFPDSVKGVSISNNHLIITTQGGIREDLGVINPYADTIVLNSETNTTEIGNNLRVNGNVQLGQQLNVNGASIFNGNVNFSGGEINIEDNVYLSDSYALDFTLGGMITDYVGNTGVNSPNKVLGTNDEGHIVYKNVSGGTQWYKHDVNIATSMGGMTIGIVFYSMFGESLKDNEIPSGNYVAIMTSAGGPSAPNADTSFPVFNASNQGFMFKYLGTDGTIQRYTFNKTSINSDMVTAL